MTLAGTGERSLDRESLTITGLAKNPVTLALEPKTYTYEAGKSYNITSSSGAVQQRYGNDIIRNYWGTYYPLETANFITKTNWIRMRSVSLTYNLPQEIINKQKVLKDLSITVAGNNLLLLTNYKGMDPETSVAGSGVVGSSSAGIDYCGVPATAGVSVGLNITF
jgi:hypothetical protein